MFKLCYDFVKVIELLSGRMAVTEVAVIVSGTLATILYPLFRSGRYTSNLFNYLSIPIFYLVLNSLVTTTILLSTCN